MTENEEKPVTIHLTLRKKHKKYLDALCDLEGHPRTTILRNLIVERVEQYIEKGRIVETATEVKPVVSRE